MTLGAGLWGLCGQQVSVVLLCPPDTVKFGEVALQPPELTARPRTGMNRGQVSRDKGMALFGPGAHGAKAVGTT